MKSHNEEKKFYNLDVRTALNCLEIAISKRDAEGSILIPGNPY
jgi:hypothetical protein